MVENGPFVVSVCTVKALLYEQPQTIRIRHHDKVEIAIPFGTFDEQDNYPDLFMVSVRTVFGLTNFVNCKPLGTKVKNKFIQHITNNTLGRKYQPENGVPLRHDCRKSLVAQTASIPWRHLLSYEVLHGGWLI